MVDDAKTALIFGITGQDGAYLAKLLLDKKYRVHGTSRDAAAASFENLRRLGIRDQVSVHSAVLTDIESVTQSISEAEPSEIYNLGGMTSVARSFEQSAEALDSIAAATLTILQAIRQLGGDARFYNACSSECFGDTGERAATEDTPFRPKSPYAIAKMAGYWYVANYRTVHDLHASSGILFNHESPLRPPRFVTRKVVSAAARIAEAKGGELLLGNLNIERDWGWAPEYVEAMWLMLQQDQPDDYVIATGESHALREFVAAAFSHFGLDWKAHVKTDSSLLRPADAARSRGNPAKAHDRLGWTAGARMEDVVRMMAQAETALTMEAG